MGALHSIIKIFCCHQAANGFFRRAWMNIFKKSQSAAIRFNQLPEPLNGNLDHAVGVEFRHVLVGAGFGLLPPIRIR